MAKKYRGFCDDAGYNAGRAWNASPQAVTEAEAQVYQLLKLKRSNFNTLEEKEQKAILSRDPYHCDYVSYDEKIEDGLQDVTLADLFTDIAEKYDLKLKENRRLITQDFMLIDALTERDRRWRLGGSKNRKAMDMPQFAVDGKTRKARFWVMQTALKILGVSRHDAAHYAALPRTEAPLPYTTSAVVMEEESREQVQGKRHNEDVAGAMPKVKSETSAAEELARLRAENAALKAKEAGKEYVKAPVLADTVNAFGQIISH